MRTSLILLLTGCLLVALGSAGAQMRPGQPPTLSPPAPAAQAPDAIGAFRAEYRAAGSPRVVLFWNISFDDATQTPKVDVTVQRAEVAPVESEDGTTGVGAVGVRAHASGYLDAASHGFGDLSARDLATLDSTFRDELLAVQVRLLDRATTLRFMQAQRDRAHVDPKLIEADAVLGKADILLQVLLVRDPASPLDAGFKVSATRVRTGTEIASLYTLAVPNLPTLPGRYVATDKGFRWRQAPPPTPDAVQIATELASEVMQKLGPALASRP